MEGAGGRKCPVLVGDSGALACADAGASEGDSSDGKGEIRWWELTFSPVTGSMEALELRLCSAADEFEIHGRFIRPRWGSSRVRRLVWLGLVLVTLVGQGLGVAFGLSGYVGFGFQLWSHAF